MLLRFSELCMDVTLALMSLLVLVSMAGAVAGLAHLLWVQLL
jgi:hypothetical protein